MRKPFESVMCDEKGKIPLPEMTEAPEEQPMLYERIGRTPGPGNIYFEPTGTKGHTCRIMEGFYFVSNKPNWWIRLWQRLFLGWVWTKDPRDGSERDLITR